MVKPSKAFVPQAEDISASSREIFQVGSLFASLLSKRETDRILKFGLQSTVGRIPIKTYFGAKIQMQDKVSLDFQAIWLLAIFVKYLS